jgi:hypothetical protein
MVKKVLCSVTFRRILVIFVVGLMSRTVVNHTFDVNVFKDYSTTISLVYYGFMACFSVIVSEMAMFADTDSGSYLSKGNMFFHKNDNTSVPAAVTGL